MNIRVGKGAGRKPLQGLVQEFFYSLIFLCEKKKTFFVITKVAPICKQIQRKQKCIKQVLPVPDSLPPSVTVTMKSLNILAFLTGISDGQTDR